MPDSPPFEKSLFINCPFDKDFKPLLRAILFAAIERGLEPRIASERVDSGENRLQKGRGETMAGRRSYLGLLRSVMADRDRQTHLMLHIAGWFQGGSRVELPSQLGRWDKPGQFNMRGRRNGWRVTRNSAEGWVLNRARDWPWSTCPTGSCAIWV